MYEAPPQGVLIALVVTVAVLFVVLGLWLPLTFFIRPLFVSAKSMGIRFYFRPLEKLYFEPRWSKDWNPKYVEDYVARYSIIMPQAYEAIGIKVTKDQILDHADKVKCTIQVGALTDNSARHGDINNDGKPDIITGLTYDEETIQVGLLPNMFGEDGKFNIERTAFPYEFHNAMIMAFAGYNVSLGESFVPPNDPRLLPWLGGQSLQNLKTKRAVLDAAYEQIRM